MCDLVNIYFFPKNNDKTIYWTKKNAFDENNENAMVTRVAFLFSTQHPCLTTNVTLLCFFSCMNQVDCTYRVWYCLSRSCFLSPAWKETIQVVSTLCSIFCSHWKSIFPLHTMHTIDMALKTPHFLLLGY